MAALLKLRNFQFRFIDFLARGVGKSSRNATAFNERFFLTAFEIKGAHFFDLGIFGGNVCISDFSRFSFLRR